MKLTDIILEYNNPDHAKAYQQGKAAAEIWHATGMGASYPAGGTCPYKDGTEEHNAWKHGWWQGYHETHPANGE